MITLIAAVDKNFGIGYKGTMPWSIPEDLAFFKKETLGGACIMGRKTWESLPGALPGRENIVVSKTLTHVDGASIVGSVDEAMELATKSGYMRHYCIGGQSLYTHMMTFADRVVLTHLDMDAPADTWFPKLPGVFLSHKSLRLSDRAVVQEYMKL